jgi:lipopolysaccharide exporter
MTGSPENGSRGPLKQVFLRPVSTLLSGSGLAFLIGYLAKPILLRLFPVAAFGVYDFVMALVAIALPVASLRYEDAIMLPDSDEEARDVLTLSGLLTLGTALLLGAAILVFSPLIRDQSIRPWLWSVPVLLLILRISKLSELWLTRRQRFGVISSGNAAQSAVMTLTRIGAGVRGAGPGGLLLGFAVGHLTAAVSYGWAAVRSIPFSGKVLLRSTAARYRRFPQFAAPASLVSALTTRLPFLMLMAVFGSEVLGWFGQAFNILYIPLSLIGTAMGQVFFVRAVEARRSGSLNQETHEVHRWLILATIVPIAGISAAAPDVFSFMFGEAWRTAGEYAVWIAPWVVLSAIASPLTRVFDVLEMQRRDLLINGLAFLLLASALIIGARFPEPRPAIILLGAMGSLARAGQILATLHTAGVGLADSLRLYVRPLLEGLVIFLGVMLAASRLAPAMTTLLLAIVMLSWLFITFRRLR